MSASSPRPSLSELRAVAQPPSIFARNSGEHWAGRLYVRRISIHLTRLVIPTRVTPNAMTWAMLAVGIAAAAVLTLPGIWPAVVAVLLIQSQILLDCSDGELARWRQQFSPRGVYLDRLGHYVTETALPIGLGIRADGGWDAVGGTYTTLGLVAAVLALMVRMEGVLVGVARAESGREAVADTAEASAPRGGMLRTVRRRLGLFPFFRAFVAIEATLLALLAAIGDELAGDLSVTRALVIVLGPVAAITAVGRLAAIMSSERLR
ncbi:MAG TPA: CDP-alcohol phosphatidyltransferase family protein [Solirubrobacteraceae bacterium]|nr:CDP-alcohol phosphatidyltransferase family protein [Solirubrobacteraceae bacterium]